MWPGIVLKSHSRSEADYAFGQHQIASWTNDVTKLSWLPAIFGLALTKPAHFLERARRAFAASLRKVDLSERVIFPDRTRDMSWPILDRGFFVMPFSVDHFLRHTTGIFFGI